ncbi:trypsin-like peptidase domain-containing protein [Isosphaeraceae bacterium EP7]
MNRNLVAWAALVVSTASLVSSQAMTRKVPAAPDLPAEGQKVARELSEAFEAVSEFVKPSVVQISVQRKSGATAKLRGAPGRGNPFGPNGNVPTDPKELQEMLKKFFGPEFKLEKEQFSPGEQGTGSGFVYDDKGHLLTNNHVVEGAEKLVVTFHDGTELPAKVVGTDPETDVAVIKVDSSEYRAMLRGNSSKLRVGEWILAVGSPFGLSQTVTAGIISATERNEIGINPFEAFIQTDAAINPGNSGGPMVDMNGRVVGINSAIVTGTRSNAGVGFAIPIDMASELADKLIRDGKVNRARMGVGLEVLTPILAKQLGLDSKTKGIVVDQVLKGSPADKAGLKVGDVILSFNGEPVLSRASFRIKVSSSDTGKAYDLGYFREGENSKTSVTLAPQDQVVFDQERVGREQRAEKEATKKEETPAPKVVSEGFGLEVQPLTPELAKQFGHAEGTEGLVISKVKPGGEAEAAGLESGQVITKVIKDKKVTAVSELKDFDAILAKGDTIAVFIEVPGGVGKFVTLSKVSK